MERAEYIQLFNRFLERRATTQEVLLLIQWLKNEGSFSNWADEEWDTASSDMNSVLQQQLFEQIREKLQIKGTAKTMQKSFKQHILSNTGILRIAAVFLLLIVSGLSILYINIPPTPVSDMTVSVEKGQKANVTLPDGSLVWINSDSHLTYGNRFNGKERVIQLKGEGYFEVVPDKQRPFIVETAGLSIQALGTSFDIKAYSDDDYISAVLMTGKVSIKSAHETQLLLPNERLVFNKQTGTMQKGEVEDASSYSGWKNNTLSFKSETFENIVKTLERNYNTKIIFESESLKKYRFTGSPNNTSLESTLQILSLTSPLIYKIQQNLIILQENTKQKAYYENELK